MASCISRHLKYRPSISGFSVWVCTFVDMLVFMLPFGCLVTVVVVVVVLITFFPECNFPLKTFIQHYFGKPRLLLRVSIDYERNERGQHFGRPADRGAEFFPDLQFSVAIYLYLAVIVHMALSPPIVATSFGARPCIFINVVKLRQLKSYRFQCMFRSLFPRTFLALAFRLLNKMLTCSLPPWRRARGDGIASACSTFLYVLHNKGLYRCPLSLCLYISPCVIL